MNISRWFLFFGAPILLFGCANSKNVPQNNSLQDFSKGNTFARYQPAKLIDIVVRYKPVIDHDIKNAPADKPYLLIDHLGPAFRVKAKFSKEFRTLSIEHKEIIEAWLTSIRKKGLINLFHQEVKIMEDDIAYWLPIQEQLMPYLIKEIGLDEVVEFYVVYFGAYQYDHIFVINEFQKVY